MAHHLLKSQQNSVYEAIAKAGFEPSDFGWEEATGEAFWEGGFPGRIPVIVHEPSGAAFIFDFDSSKNHHMAIYTPGSDRFTEKYRPGDWQNQLGYVERWLDNLKREYYAPNLWTELEEGAQLSAALETTADDDNRPFTSDEQAEVSRHLKEIKELLIRTEQLEGAKLRALEARLDYLEDASTRMGRRDWLAIFYGSVFQWALSALVTPDGARQVLMSTAHTLGHLFGGGLPQLPG